MKTRYYYILFIITFITDICLCEEINVYVYNIITDYYQGSYAGTTISIPLRGHPESNSLWSLFNYAYKDPNYSTYTYRYASAHKDIFWNVDGRLRKITAPVNPAYVMYSPSHKKVIIISMDSIAYYPLDDEYSLFGPLNPIGYPLWIYRSKNTLLHPCLYSNSKRNRL